MFSVAAYANDVKELNSLAMHSSPKYGQGTPKNHLDYVNPDAPKGGHIKMAASRSSFDTLNPYSLKGQAAENMGLINDRLMRRVWDEPFSLYPLIAQSIEMPEDRSSITFHIHPQARFHDGSPITSADVLFSYKTLKEKGRPNAQRIYKLVDRVERINERTITFTFGEGFDRETAMIIAIMPVLSENWWKDRDFEAALTDIPLGNGPYKIKSFEMGRTVTYERVKDYWAKDLFANVGHYNFDTITYDYFRDDTIALEAFKKGDLDLRREWDITKWQSGYDGLRPHIIKGTFSHNRPERAHGFIFNLRRSIFTNDAIRQALSLAFNEEWVGKNIYHGQFKRIHSVFPNSVLAHTTQEKSPTSYRTALKHADTLLKDNGWVIKDGKRVNQSNGDDFSFELIVSTPIEEKIALAYKNNLARLGIELTIRVLDSATFQQRKLNYDYDMIATFWQNSLSPGTEQMLYWSCKAANEPARFNYSGICKPELDQNALGIANALTYDSLIEHAHKIDNIVMSSHVMIPFFYKDVDYIAYDNQLKQPKESPIYGTVIESWWIEQQE